MCPNYCVACSHFAPVVGDVHADRDEPGSMCLWLSSWLEDGNSQTSESPSWFMQVWFGSAIFCKRMCCPFMCPSDMMKGRGSSPISPLYYNLYQLPAALHWALRCCFPFTPPHLRLSTLSDKMGHLPLGQRSLPATQKLLWQIYSQERLALSYHNFTAKKNHFTNMQTPKSAS